MSKDSLKQKTVKDINSRINGLNKTIRMQEHAVKLANDALTKSKREHEKLMKELDNVTNSRRIQISDHALLRYIQRVKQINVSEIHDTILSDKFLKQIETVGDGRYPISEEFEAIVTGRVIVSIVPIKYKRETACEEI